MFFCFNKVFEKKKENWHISENVEFRDGSTTVLDLETVQPWFLISWFVHVIQMINYINFLFIYPLSIHFLFIYPLSIHFLFIYPLSIHFLIIYPLSIHFLFIYPLSIHFLFICPLSIHFLFLIYGFLFLSIN